MNVNERPFREAAEASCRATGQGVNLLCRWMSEVTERTRTLPLAPNMSVRHVPPLTCATAEGARPRIHRLCQSWQLDAYSSGPQSTCISTRALTQRNGQSVVRIIGPGAASRARGAPAALTRRCGKRRRGYFAATLVAAWWTTKLRADKRAQQAEARSPKATDARAPRAQRTTNVCGSPAASARMPPAS